MEVTVQSAVPVHEKQSVRVSEVPLVEPDVLANRAMIDHVQRETAKAINTQAGTAAFNSGDVRVVGVNEYKQAALCLAEAFATDDVARYFTHTPDRSHWTDAQLWDLHVRILEYVVYAHILNGLVLTAGDNYGCVALWMPPGKNMDDWVTIMRSGQWRMYYQLSAEGKSRYFDEFFPLLHQTKMNVLKERDDDSWYLVYLGTKPTAQKQGLAKKVIDHVTAIADAEGRPSYLESSHAHNVPYYRKRGFEVCRTIYLQRCNKPIELDIMVREPVKRVGDAK